MRKYTTIQKCVFIFFMFIFLDAFTQSANEFQFISPVPGSINNTRESTIIIRAGATIDPAYLSDNGLFEVSGSVSGKVSGKVILSSDGKTVIFEPSRRFAPNENVEVRLNKVLRTADGDLLPASSFSFHVTPLYERANPMLYLDAGLAEDWAHIKPTQPSKQDGPRQPPSVRTEVFGETARGYVFITVSNDIPEVGFYISMLRNDGTAFFERDLIRDYSNDFKVQANGTLSYAQFLTHYTYTGGGDVIHMIMDNSFTVIDSFQMKNGYTAEAHDFLLLPNGHALLFAYDLQPMDLTHLGGHPNALVAQSVIQELDIDKNVVFQWRSSDHYDFFDTFRTNFSAQAFDPVHVNSLNIDQDGHILITPNALAEITKINRQTGEIIWRMGGKKNEFTFQGLENPAFTGGTHNVTRQANGNITLLDNTRRGSSASARAVEYEVDEINKIATLVWQYVPEKPVLSTNRGSVQRLPNGNTMIGWGGASVQDSLVATEVTSAGEVVFNLYFNHTGMASYRAFRFPFPDGQPLVQVTEFEVSAGNTFDFELTDSVDIGIDVKINDLNAPGYNELIASRYDFAPMEPEFFGKAPIVQPLRLVLSDVGINSIEADVMFDVASYGVREPENTMVYHREFAGSGLFVPLATTYNNVTQEVIANTSKLGEFILARPDFDSIVFTPLPFQPADSSTVNQTLPVVFRWNPIGYVNGYTFQLSQDPDFNTNIIDVNDLTEAILTVDTVEDGVTYYWRVAAFNDAGDSEWTDTQTFTTVAPFISVSSPNGGEEWQRGIPHFIQWQDNIDEEVIVELHRSSGLVAVLDTVASSGAYNWDIPLSLETDVDYLVVTRGLGDPALVDTSDGFFTIMDSTITSLGEPAKVPDNFALYQNYPNPFNPNTTIRYELPENAKVELIIYNSIGQKVRTLVNSDQTAGLHAVQWDGKNEDNSLLASGLYFYKLLAKNLVFTRKLILLR